MSAESHQFHLKTKGHTQVLDITGQIARCVRDGGVRCGTATAFVIGSTAGITTTEFEPGLVTQDLKVAFEKIAPEHDTYLHEQTWHDDNGHSHVRASLIGPSLTVPVVDGKLALGTWQQIILIDFDTRPRDRTVLVQIIGD
jgi:secondary thiamine-phosphate synthase enzyme